jgi:hypothetical protein
MPRCPHCDHDGDRDDFLPTFEVDDEQVLLNGLVTCPDCEAVLGGIAKESAAGGYVDRQGNIQSNRFDSD